MNDPRLILKKANNYRIVLKEKGSIRRSNFTAILALVMVFSLGSSLCSQTIAQETIAEQDTSSVNIDIPFYQNEFRGTSTVLTQPQLQVFGDFSLREALVRLPGVHASRDGDINIRGVGFDTYSVSVDGFRLANTGMGSRSVDLGALSSDTFSEIQLIKVLDPSMDADALAGSINLSTKKPVGDSRQLSAIVGGGANSNYIGRAGPSSRGLISYSDHLRDKISYSVNLNYQQEQNTREELRLDYGVEDFGNGAVDVIEGLAPSLQNDERGRFSASVNTHYTPTSYSDYYIRGFFNNEARELTRHEDSYIPNGNWIDQFTTGAQDAQGTYSHFASQQNIDLTQFAFHGGGENDFEDLILSYNAGWSQSRTENTDFLFPFQIDELNYSVDMSDRNHPQFTFINRPLQVNEEDGTIDRQFMMAQDFNRITEDHVNNQYSARADIEYPIAIGSVKAGTSVRLSAKEGEFDDHNFSYYQPGNLRMINFHLMKEPVRNIDVINDNYRIPWFINTEYTRAFFENQRPLFSSDENVHAYNSAIYNYKATDVIYAGYVMGDLEFGNIQVKGGIRAEQTNSDYDGNQVIFDDTGEHIETSNSKQSNSDFQLFPNAQLIFSPTGQNKVHLAYSRTIDRPDYFQQTPFERIDNQDSVIFNGNHQLEPIFSNNFDLMFDQQLGNSGAASVAGFYKQLSNFIVLQERTLTSGQYNQYQEQVFENSNQTASIYGVELAFQQSLSFLPGLLNNLGVYTNYTWSQSNYETQRGDETALPGHSPHILNAALSYTQGRFFGQVKYHWSAEMLQQVQNSREMAPSASSSPLYLDRYEDGYQDLSATIKFKLSEQFRFWAHVKNLLNTEQVRYAYDEKFYPTSTYIQEGLELRLGIRYDL